MQNNPFGHLLPQQPAPTPAQQPTVIGGRRVIGSVAPAERRAEEDQALEREKFARQQAVEEERLRLARQAEERTAEQAQRGGVEQGKAASFLRRAINAEQNFRNLGDVQPRSLPGQAVKDAFPNVANIMSDSERQRADQAEREFIGAILRYDSGAAIPPEEFVTNGQIYFPRPGDTPEVLAQKAEARRVAIEGLYAAAGPAGQQIEMPDFSQPAKPRQADKRDEMPYGAQLAIDGGNDDPFDRARYLQERFGIDPGAETRLVGMLNANNGNPNVSPDMVLRMYADAGVPPPAEQDLAALVEDMRSGRFAPASAIDTSAAEQSYVQGLDTIINRAGFNPEATEEAAGLSTRQGAAFEGFDEITGVVNAIAEGLQFNNPIEGYRTGRDVTRRMVERADAANPGIAIGGRIVGSLPTGIVGSAGRANTLASAARTGAVEGGVVGFNQGEGLGGSALGLAVGTPLGAGLGIGLQAGGNKIQNALRGQAPQVDPAQARSIADAGQRRQVTTRIVDLDPALRNRRGQIQQTEQGRNAIAAAEQNDLAEIETALIRDLGGRAGTQRTEAATAVQQGVKGARDRLRKDAQIEYRAASAQAGNISAPPTNAIAQIDQQIAELAANGRKLNSKEIAYLKDLKSDLAAGLSIDGLRAQRTGLRKRLENAGVYSDDFERRLGLVFDDASKDIEAALQPFPQALSRYREGDRLWAQQADLGRKVGDKLLGRDGNMGPGQAADQITLWSKKDPARLARMLDEVDDATKEEVRALVVSQLGRQANGNFSLAAFLTQTGSGRGGALSPKAMRVLFGDEGVKAIEDLRILSQAKVDAASATNRSNTGSLVERARGSLRRLVLGAFGFNAAAEPMTGALVSGAAVAGGEFFNRLGTERAIRLLLNPDVTGWLRRLPNTNNPQAINRSFAGLRSIASRSPVMMTDVQALERALIEVANDNTTRLAAEPSGADNQR